METKDIVQNSVKFVKSIEPEFLDELRLQVKSFDTAGTLGITPCFGITRNPKDDESILYTTELYKQIKVIEKSIELDQKILDVKGSSITYETHPQAVYKSRPLEVNKSSKINSEPTIESSLMDLVVPDDSDDDC
ncbi:unnamed protein product [Rhizophagus irregularis]|nr:unnamed protein product [Rhizophagus irregularis]